MAQATDSTCMGWTAKTAATAHAPGTAKYRSRRHSSRTLAMYNTKLTRWVPKGVMPQSLCSSQNVV